ncbi:MFS transporter [Ferrimicrobium acidiphilum]|uniref:MFS transporter n=1 Tax=Ferrimicrobium acidiphilum TaxID=121039 RepID=UPI0023EF6204|nr:MFS transporter [Ferrimicrobium acidiphilum]
MRTRNAIAYIFGTLLTGFGDKVLFIAAGIWVRELTGSNASAGLTFFFYIAPSMVVGPLAGLIVDRFPRRWVLITANALSTLSLLGLIGVHGASDIWRIYLVILIYGALATVSSAAGVGLRTTVFDPEQFGSVNGLLSTVSEGLRLVVPLVGAGLFVLAGAMAVITIDIGTYILAIGLFLFIRVEEQHEASTPQHWRVQALAGVRHIVATPLLRRLAWAVTVLLCTVGFFETAMFAVATNGLRRSAAFVGVFIAFQGVGAIIGGVATAQIMRKVGELKTAALGMVTVALGSGIVLVGVQPHSLSALVIVCGGTILLGVGITLLLVSVNTAIQRSTPNRLMGRVDAAFNVIFNGVQSVSIALGAGLVALVGFDIPIVLIASSALIGTVMLGYRTPAMEPAQE